VFASEEPPAGFLRMRSELLDVPLAPAQEMRIGVVAEWDRTQKQVARTWNRYGWLLTTLADALRIKPGVAVAVTSGLTHQPGISREGRMRLRFENHIFFDSWGRENRELFETHFRFDAARPWQKHQWRPLPDGAWHDCHKGHGDEWSVFEFAQSLDDTAAKLSAAMGAPHILGLNYAAIGHRSVDQMFADFSRSEGYQIIGLFDLIGGPQSRSRPLAALQAVNFEDFAALHLGGGQAARYSSLLRRAFEAFERLMA